MRKTLFTYFLLVTLVGCSSAKPAEETFVSARMIEEIPCTSAGELNVFASDGVDDRASLQEAISTVSLTTGCLQLSPGNYEVSRQQPIGTDYRPSIQITRPIILRGAGKDATTIYMVGSGIKENTVTPADWVLLQIMSEGVTIEDLALDGSLRSNTNEQTHLIEVQGPSKRIVLQRLNLNLPVQGPNSGGDCIRLMGSFPSRVRNVVVSEVTGLECDRSWVSIQRGVHNVILQDSSTIRVGDQAIDFEPTAHENFCANNSEPSVTEIRMQRLNLQRGSLGRGNYTVAIAGAAACAPASGIWLTDSTIGQGGIWIHNAQRTQLLRLNYQQ